MSRQVWVSRHTARVLAAFRPEARRAGAVLAEQRTGLLSAHSRGLTMPQRAQQQPGPQNPQTRAQGDHQYIPVSARGGGRRPTPAFNRRVAVDRVAKVAAEAMRGMAHALDPLEQAIEALKINPTDLRRHADLLEQGMLVLPDDDAALSRAILMVRESLEVDSRMRLVADSINVMAGYASQSADKVIRTLNDLMESNPDASKT